MILWAHDIRLIRNGNSFYSSGGLTVPVLERYIEAFGAVTLVTRARDLADQDPSRFTRLESAGLSFRPVPWNLRGVSTLWSLVRSADGVIARVPSVLGTMAASLAIHAQTPLYVEVVGSAWDSLRFHGKVGPVLAPGMEIATRHVVRGASSAIYVTEEFLQRRYPCHGETTSCSDVEVAPDPRDLETRLSEPTALSRSLTVGTLAAVDVVYKGQADVIRALPTLSAMGLDVHYQIAGPGDSTRLSRLAADLGVLDRVNMIGPIPRGDVLSYMRSLDVYVQPSATEGMPRALLEAMSVGCPALGTRVGGIPEVLPKSCLYTYGRADELVERFVSLTREVRHQHSVRNFARAQAFSGTMLDERRRDSLRRFASLIGATNGV